MSEMSESQQCARCRNMKPMADFSVNKNNRRLKTCDKCRAIKRTRDRRQHSGCGMDFRKVSQPLILGDDRRYLIALRLPMSDVGQI